MPEFDLPQFDLIKLDEVDSTNRFLKTYLPQHEMVRPLACVTRCQTAGYGQRQAVWLTNAQSCIFSIAWPLGSPSPIQPNLSLQVALALHQSLIELTQAPLWLKWPNDLYSQDGKVSGILIEVNKDKNGQTCLVIGIGINRQACETETENKTEQLAEGAGALAYFETEDLLSLLIQRLSLKGIGQLKDIDQLEEDYWQRYDYFSLGERIDVLCNQTQSTEAVIYQGVSSKGEALLQSAAGIVKLVSAQKSLRKQKVSE